MRNVVKRARDLVHTSVDDLRSSLQCSRQYGGESRDVLTSARDLAESMGQRTKARVIEAELRRVEQKGAKEAKGDA